MKIDEAKEEFDFFNEGDYITRGMAEAKDIVLQELKNTQSDLYEANHRITDLLLILGDRDRIIDEMAKEILLKYQLHYKTVDDIRKIYEERCEDAKNKS
jgi:hypothetical protein